jgi:hypothetical protein
MLTHTQCILTRYECVKTQYVNTVHLNCKNYFFGLISYLTENILSIIKPSHSEGQVRRLSCSVSHFCPILTKTGQCRQSLVEIQNVDFHEAASHGSFRDTCGLTDGQTNMTRLTAAFPSCFSSVSKNVAVLDLLTVSELFL